MTELIDVSKEIVRNGKTYRVFKLRLKDGRTFRYIVRADLLEDTPYRHTPRFDFAPSILSAYRELITSEYRTYAEQKERARAVVKCTACGLEVKLPFSSHHLDRYSIAPIVGWELTPPVCPDCQEGRDREPPS